MTRKQLLLLFLLGAVAALTAALIVGVRATPAPPTAGAARPAPAKPAAETPAPASAGRVPPPPRSAPAPVAAPDESGAAEKHPVVPLAIVDVRNQLRPIVRRCDKTFGAHRGPRPTLRALVTVDALRGRLAVRDVAIELGDVEDDGLVDCVRSGALRLELDVSGRDQPDVEAHVLTLPFRLQPGAAAGATEETAPAE